MEISRRDRLFLLRELTLRDIKLRYIGSVMGLFWSVVHPVFMLLLYTLIFSKVLRPDWPQARTVGSLASYLFAGLLPWIQFHEAVTRCATVYLENSNLIRKVKFPVELLPGSTVLSSIGNLLVAIVVFVAVLLLRSQGLSWSLFWLVPALLLQTLGTFGLGLLVASSNVFVRDIPQFLAVGFPFLFWATPIVYPPTALHGYYHWLSNANPLTHLVALYRAALFGGGAPGLLPLAYLSLVCLGMLIAGRALLERTRGILSDYI